MNDNNFSLADIEPIIREVISGGGEFELFPRGTSMLPLLVQGRDSVVLVSPPQTLSVGDIALYKRSNGQYVLHRVIGFENGLYTMCGDNQTTPEPGISHGQIIAVVSSMCIKGKKVAADDKKYLRYVKRNLDMSYRKRVLFVFHIKYGFARRLGFGRSQKNNGSPR